MQPKTLMLPSGGAAAPSFRPESSVVSDVVPSPNCGERKNARAVDMLVLHYTGMTDVDAALTRLCTAGSDVSAHYVVLEDGRVIQCVREAMRAWHAGAAFWAGESDINSCSIGIEIVNRGHDWGYPDYPSRQIAAVTALCRGVMLRHTIPAKRVLGHSDVSPSRKKDPGEKFPWRSLANSGVGHWVAPEPFLPGEEFTLGSRGDKVEALQNQLANYGYGVKMTGDYDATTADVVTAFQRHFRPERVDGIADVSTRATLQTLLRAF